ncbi:MAG: HVO_0416 family zinc finger protein [Salinigranum sp.]
MATEPSEDELFDRFLDDRGHETEPVRWDRSYNKKQCPDCGGLHDLSAQSCSVCGWEPHA